MSRYQPQCNLLRHQLIGIDAYLDNISELCCQDLIFAKELKVQADSSKSHRYNLSWISLKVDSNRLFPFDYVTCPAKLH